MHGAWTNDLESTHNGRCIYSFSLLAAGLQILRSAKSLVHCWLKSAMWWARGHNIMFGHSCDISIYMFIKLKLVCLLENAHPVGSKKLLHHPWSPKANVHPNDSNTFAKIQGFDWPAAVVGGHLSIPHFMLLSERNLVKRSMVSFALPTRSCKSSWSSTWRGIGIKHKQFNNYAPSSMHAH